MDQISSESEYNQALLQPINDGVEIEGKLIQIKQEKTESENGKLNGNLQKHKQFQVINREMFFNETWRKLIIFNSRILR